MPSDFLENQVKSKPFTATVVFKSSEQTHYTCFIAFALSNTTKEQ